MADQFIKQIEEQYLDKKIKFEFRENEGIYDFLISNCQEPLLDNLVVFLKMECSKKKLKSIEINALPGMEKLLQKSNSMFMHDLNSLKSILKNNV